MIVGDFGTRGAASSEVLARYAKELRYQFRSVGSEGATKALQCSRSVLLSISLPREVEGRRDPWRVLGECKDEPLSVEKFSKSLRTTRDAVLAWRYGDTDSHAMVIVAHTPNAWVVKNSWGAAWGTHGYFLLAKDEELHRAVRARFIDVFWAPEDLADSERTTWRAADAGARAAFERSRVATHYERVRHIPGVLMPDGLEVQLFLEEERALRRFEARAAGAAHPGAAPGALALPTAVRCRA